jgi:RNA polymerase sigma-70 factor, ECF subfamily
MADIVLKADAIPPAQAVMRAGSAPSQAMTVKAQEISDAELLQRVARSDALSGPALETLFLRHSEALLRFLARTMRSDQESEDVVHDVFLRLTECAGSFRGDCAFRTWLFTLAVNNLRSKQRRAALESRSTETIAMKMQQLAARKQHNPEQKLQHRELLHKVDAAIAQLAESERETFLLYWFGEMSYAEISELTGLSVAAAKVRVHRALARLSNTLDVIR